MEFEQANETGRKTFLWYRVYLALLAIIYLAVGVFGAVLATVPLDGSTSERQQMLVIGIVYAVLGATFFVLFVVAFFLPPKPYNWIVGIVMLAIGMTSCCFLPAVVPLLIFWVKPETQAFFGRKQAS